MKRIWLVLALIVIAIITLNVMVMYLIYTRPSTGRVQQMIDAGLKTGITPSLNELAAVTKQLSDRTVPQKGDSGMNGISGKNGKDGTNGADGQSIVGPVGPSGPKGEPGVPGREVEIRQDPVTHELYTRYTGDDAWTLVEAP